MTDYISPLRRARGLGAAKDGTHHWWMQRVTALALVPLGLWFVLLTMSLIGQNYQAMVCTLSEPVNAVLLLLLVIGSFYHAALGMQVVLEDYVSHELTRMISITVVKLLCVAGAVACGFSILKVAIGG